MASNAIAPRRLHQHLVKAITERIVAGEIEPGALLPTEAEMGLQYGVSRTVVREALRVLDQKGMIEVRHGSGTRVTAAERWDYLDADIIMARRERGAMLAVFHDLLEARRIVECEAAALAADRARDPDYARLTAALATMRVSLHDPAAFGDADVAFHRALIMATDNQVLMRMSEPLRALLDFAMHTTNAIPGVLTRALQDHVTIYRAVKRGDAEGARTAMRRHLAKTERDINALMQTEAP